MALEIGEAGIELPEVGYALGDVTSPLGDQAWQPRAGVGAMARVAEGGKHGRVTERQVQAPQVDEQAEVLGVGFPVFAIAVVLAWRTRQPALPLVKPHSVGRDADPFREFADSHAATQPWSSSNVKRPRDASRRLQATP